MGNVDTSTANSVDYVLGGVDRHRGAPASFSNTASDWNNHRGNEMSGPTDHISEPRTSKWAVEFGRLDDKYSKG